MIHYKYKQTNSYYIITVGIANTKHNWYQIMLCCLKDKSVFARLLSDRMPHVFHSPKAYK